MLLAKGNKKLPKTTWIFNASAAVDCPSRRLGLCQCPDKCYALKAERMYKNVIPYRRKQAALWRRRAPTYFVHDIHEQSERSKDKCKAFRFNEAGDFLNQDQLDWFASVCELLDVLLGITCYGYTARTDLDLSGLIAHAGVNVSNDEGGWQQSHRANRFKYVKQKTGEHPVCPGDCRKCTMCCASRGSTIEVEEH